MERQVDHETEVDQKKVDEAIFDLIKWVRSSD
jgi:hypothetical protein